jgi:hypothetical protein
MTAIETMASSPDPVLAERGREFTPELLGWADRVGRLARGFSADLVAVPSSPLDDPGVLLDVRLVVAQGVVAHRA